MKPTDSINPDTDFARYFIDNGKPASAWAIGPEIEVFGFTAETLERITPAQVQAVIEGFFPGIVEVQREDDFIIEATLVDQSRITLEPGGQIEFSGPPQTSLAAIERGAKQYFSQLSEIGERLGIRFLAVGFDPLRKLEEQHWISKRRYEIMRPYLAQRGRRAWDMMCRTVAIQVNLDYSDLEDLAKKFTVASRLAPVAAGLFANSPFEEGRLSGYKSTRYAAWLETDRQRTGATPCTLDGVFSLSRLLDHIKQVPMFFIRRDEGYINLAGGDFNRFLIEGSHAGGPIWQDFTDHLSTIFTEARLKPYLEQRSMDCGQLEMVMAAMAFWKGLLYDQAALDQAFALAPKLTIEDYRALQLEVARFGLQAEKSGVFIADLAKSCVKLARRGLHKIAPAEVRYLDVLEQYGVGEQICPADILLKNFNGRWHGDMQKAIDFLQVRPS